MQDLHFPRESAAPSPEEDEARYEQPAAGCGATASESVSIRQAGLLVRSERVRRAASYARLVAAGGAVPQPAGDCTEAGSGTGSQAGGRDSWRGEVRHSCATIIFARNRRCF
jgi:hypothetical protein